MVFTKNEQKLIAYLWKNWTEQLSINELAKRLGLTPRGAHVILKKFEKNDLVKKKKIANAAIYQLNYSDEKNKHLVEYALKSEPSPNPYVTVLEKDLQSLREIASAAILFGSALTAGLQARDIDLLVVINPKKLSALKAKVSEFESISPKKLHLLIQTKTDLQKNLRKKDPVVLELFKKGRVLWGHDWMYQLIKIAKIAGET